jgi:peptidylprolyl isomerase
MTRKSHASARDARRKRNRNIAITIGLLAVVAVVIVAFFIFSQPSPKYELIVGVVGSGSANVTGTQTYDSGAMVPVQANPDSGMVLSHWLINGTSVGSANPYVVTMSENRNLTAVFASGKILLQTSIGNITIQLRADKPITSGNFWNLVNQGKYDNTLFHRVMAGFMIQGGQIVGSVSTIQDEIGADNHNVRGSLAMANTGAPNSASTQFFINLVDNGAASSTFDSSYTVFGNVISGMDVVDAIAQVPVVANPANPNEISSPVNAVTLISATVLP